MRRNVARHLAASEVVQDAGDLICAAMEPLERPCVVIVQSNQKRKVSHVGAVRSVPVPVGVCCAKRFQQKFVDDFASNFVTD